jgi:xylulokinase
MKMRSYFLALDIGTSSLKAGLFDRDYNLVKTDKVDYAFETQGMNVQMDPEKIWKAFLKVARRLEAYSGKIELIVQCVLSPSLIPMDQSGDPLYPSILHWDRRSAKQAKRALALIGKERFLRSAGNLPYPGGISLTSLLWIKENENEIFRKAFKFGHMNTFFIKRLTGRWSIDPTNASLTGLYHTVAYGDWLEEFAREFEIPLEKLPPVIPCLQIVGAVTREAADATGFRSGTPVLMGSNDTSSAALGAGVLENGQILNITGSGELIAICLRTPIPDEKYYLRTHPLPNRWLMFDLTTSGFALEWFRSQFCREMGEKEFYRSYLGRILQEKRRCPVKFHPHLAGDRTSLNQKRASFTGLTLSTSRDDCLYAMMEAISGRTEKTLDKMAKQIHLDRVINLTGGGANPILLDYKRRRFPEFEIVVKEDCALHGCAYMVRIYNTGGRV